MVAHTRLWIIFLYVARDSSMAQTTSRGSLRTRTIPADSMSPSVPAPIAIPTSAVASTGASFTPSPTIATLLPPSRKRLTADFVSRKNPEVIAGQKSACGKLDTPLALAADCDWMMSYSE